MSQRVKRILGASATSLRAYSFLPFEPMCALNQTSNFLSSACGALAEKNSANMTASAYAALEAAIDPPAPAALAPATDTGTAVRVGDLEEAASGDLRPAICDADLAARLRSSFILMATKSRTWRLWESS